ncbi:MAG: DUF1491 family protein [Pseudomonadota bacterium]
MISRPAQLKTGLWIDAIIRRAESAGAFAVIARSGDRDAGSVLVMVRQSQQLTLFVPERNWDGIRVWRAQSGSDVELAKVIEGRADFDPDLNVIEIDDPKGRHFIEEPVLDPEGSQDDGADAVAVARALFRDR